MGRHESRGRRHVATSAVLSKRVQVITKAGVAVHWKHPSRLPVHPWTELCPKGQIWGFLNTPILIDKQRLISILKSSKVSEEITGYKTKSSDKSFTLTDHTIYRQFDGLSFKELPPRQQNQIKQDSIRAAIIPETWTIKYYKEYLRMRWSSFWRCSIWMSFSVGPSSWSTMAKTSRLPSCENHRKSQIPLCSIASCILQRYDP